MDINFVTGEPALTIGRTLVIADLHIGAEQDYRSAGISMPSQTAMSEESIVALLKKTKARRLIILGDVKHCVPVASRQEERELPRLMERLSRLASVEIVPGNHDGRLDRLCHAAVIHPSEGVRMDDCWLCHGHAWPSEEFLKCKIVVMGHNHPQVEFRDKLGKIWRERVWVRAELKRKPLEEHHKIGLRGSVLPGLVVMPAFSNLVGGWAMNRSSKRMGWLSPVPKDARLKGRSAPEFFGPMSKCADMRHALAYMLDGTFLGEISRI